MKNYAKLTKQLLNLESDALKLLFYFLLVNENIKIYKHYSEICFELQWKKSRYYNALHELKSNNYITKQNNIYQLNIDKIYRKIGENNES